MRLLYAGEPTQGVAVCEAAVAAKRSSPSAEGVSVKNLTVQWGLLHSVSLSAPHDDAGILRGNDELLHVGDGRGANDGLECQGN